jgi:hypothetical protein
MLVLTEDAVLLCEHKTGRVALAPSQDLVTIGGRRVLVATDPESRSISGCPNLNPAIGMRPCKTTLKVKVGYSEWVHVQGHAVCLDTVLGLTDGTPSGLVMYRVDKPGQPFVREA